MRSKYAVGNVIAPRHRRRRVIDNQDAVWWGGVITGAIAAFAGMVIVETVTRGVLS